MGERSVIEEEEVVQGKAVNLGGRRVLKERTAGCSSSGAADSVGGAATDVSEEDDEAMTELSGTAGAEDEGETTSGPSSVGGAIVASSFCGASLGPGISNGPDTAPSCCSG